MAEEVNGTAASDPVEESALQSSASASAANFQTNGSVPNGDGQSQAIGKSFLC
jgi:hypothetical protein